jgi:hypothetical protein
MSRGTKEHLVVGATTTATSHDVRKIDDTEGDSR